MMSEDKPEDENDVGVQLEDPSGRRFTLWLSVELYDALREKADRRKRSVAWLIRESLEEHYGIGS